MSRPIGILEVDSAQRSELKKIVTSPTSAQRDVLRAKIILARSNGVSQAATADEAGVRRRIVGKWEGRFVRQGLAGLRDAKGRGRPSQIPEQTKDRIITEVVRPPVGRCRWSVRGMAKHAGVSLGTVHRLWQANDIKPHIVHTVKLSNDKHSEEKFWDVIGLYLKPPFKALALCCEEKRQCQAWERTQPGLPLGEGHIQPHDYIRHGTVTLFAALNYLDGKIIGRTAARHTHRQWLVFLKQIGRETPADLDLHLIVGNDATHKHPAVTRWLAKHPRIHQHYTPASSSWMNLVERFFRDLTVDGVRDGSFESVRELVPAINTYLSERNLAPTRYVWKKSGEEILTKIQRARIARHRETGK